MADGSGNPFTEHYVPRRRVAGRPSHETIASRADVLFSATLEADLAQWRRKGYSCIGTADVVDLAGNAGPVDQLQQQASNVGAELVLFCIWPAKLRSIQRRPNGEIDFDRVVADPPASFSPKSYAVTAAMFLARSVRLRKGANFARANDA